MKAIDLLARDLIKNFYAVSSSVTFSEIIEQLLLYFELDANIESKYEKVLHKTFSSYDFSRYEDMMNFIQLIGFLHQKRLHHVSVESLLSNKNNKASTRKTLGAYYTDYRLAKEITASLLNTIVEDKGGWDVFPSLSFMEPCVGTGNFVFAYLSVLDSQVNNNDKVHFFTKVLRQIYVADIDADAVLLFKRLLFSFAAHRWGIDASSVMSEAQFYPKPLLFQETDSQIQRVDISEAFCRIENFNGFDIIITNPPYGKIRAERDRYIDITEYEKDKERLEGLANFIRTSDVFSYSVEGVLNYYKLFVEEILESYTCANAYVGLLIPSNLLSDKSCSKMRLHILEQYEVGHIRVIPENNQFFIDSTQSLMYLPIKKSGETSRLMLSNNVTDLEDFNNEGTEVDLSFLKQLSSDLYVFMLDNNLWSIFKKIHRHSLIKDLPFIQNLRGEIDLTLGSHLYQLLAERSGCLPEEGALFIRGNAIESFSLQEDRIKEWVPWDKLKASKFSSRIGHSTKPRIACQQVVNMKKSKRLTFCWVNSGFVLANSCNFMSLLPETPQFITLFSLLGVMNSTLLEWRFKITSSNNHVNNYEIDLLPLAIGEETSRLYHEIEQLTQQMVISNCKTNDELQIQLDALVFVMYGLSGSESLQVMRSENKSDEYMLNVLKIMDQQPEHWINVCVDELERIQLLYSTEIDEQQKAHMRSGVAAFITDNTKNVDLYFNDIDLTSFIIKYKRLYQNAIFNQVQFKLSNLDLEMVRSVPQGGNWKDISTEVINKSQRLKTISKTGGRTTLYGRIDPYKPSYTITTYFNRPGNGTYIHPLFDRVITPREAARLQSFPDDYLFMGSKTSLLKQIGNAVPCLLAYQIAEHIQNKTGARTAVDLFAGAGGMSEGFKTAGYHVLVAIELMKEAVETYRVNHPETTVIHGDITLPDVHSRMHNEIIGKKIDIVFGGPPCQGFSHAGKRLTDDPRNFLFKEFVEVVSKTKPDTFVMENVEGILTINAGKTFQSIKECFEELGYQVAGRKLLAADYGVPQRRKRVIIIGSLKFNPEELYPTPLFVDKKGEGIDLFTGLEKTFPSYVPAWDALYDISTTNAIDKQIPRYPQPSKKNIAYRMLMRRLINFEDFLSLLPLCGGQQPEHTHQEPKNALILG